MGTVGCNTPTSHQGGAQTSPHGTPKIWVAQNWDFDQGIYGKTGEGQKGGEKEEEECYEPRLTRLSQKKINPFDGFLFEPIRDHKSFHTFNLEQIKNRWDDQIKKLHGRKPDIDKQLQMLHKTLHGRKYHDILDALVAADHSLRKVTVKYMAKMLNIKELILVEICRLDQQSIFELELSKKEQERLRNGKSKEEQRADIIILTDAFHKWWGKHSKKDHDRLPPCPLVPKKKRERSCLLTIFCCWFNVCEKSWSGSCDYGDSLYPDVLMGHAILTSGGFTRNEANHRISRQCDFEIPIKSANDLRHTVGFWKPKLLLLLNHVQVLGFVVVVFPLSWPSGFKILANFLRNMFNDFFVSLVKLNCGIYADAMAFFYLYAAAIPVICILIVLADLAKFYSPYKPYNSSSSREKLPDIGCCRNRKENDEESTKEETKKNDEESTTGSSDTTSTSICPGHTYFRKLCHKGFDRVSWKALVFAIDILYTFVSASVFKFYQCKGFEKPSKRSYLRSDMRVMCFKHDNAGNSTLASVWDDARPYQDLCLVLFVLGIPFAQLVYMTWAAKCQSIKVLMLAKPIDVLEKTKRYRSADQEITGKITNSNRNGSYDITFDTEEKFRPTGWCCSKLAGWCCSGKAKKRGVRKEMFILLEPENDRRVKAFCTIEKVNALHDTRHYRHKDIERRAGSLYKPFKIEYWYVSVLEKLHQLLLTGLLQHFDKSDESALFALRSILICYGWMLFVVMTMPYRAQLDNILQILLKSQTILNLVFGLAETAYESETYISGKDPAHWAPFLLLWSNIVSIVIALGLLGASMSDKKFLIYRWYYYSREWLVEWAHGQKCWQKKWYRFHSNDANKDDSGYPSCSR